MQGWGWLVVVAALAFACGPSGKEMKQATAAQYTCESAEVYKAVTEVVAQTAPPLGESDPVRLIVVSEFRWHSKAGARKKEGVTRVGPEDVQFMIIATIRKAAAGFALSVEPKVLGQLAGNNRGRELTRADGDWPQFADAKVEAVVFGVYEKLKHCAAK